MQKCVALSGHVPVTKHMPASLASILGPVIRPSSFTGCRLHNRRVLSLFPSRERLIVDAEQLLCACASIAVARE